MVRGLIFTALAVVVSLVAGQCTTTTGVTAPTPPAQDPFWQPPANLNTRAQGSVFNCRRVNWKTVNGARTNGYFQYAYKTTLKNGTSAVAVATLILPNNTATSFNKLLSYQVPYDTPTSYCGMSYVFQQGIFGDSTSNTYGVDSSSGDQSPTQALAAGIPVVISDYETDTASFTIGITAGLATLNGIRAVINTSGFFTSNPSVALWGYSGGALATDFAMELAGGATDLTIIAAALGGLTPITRNTALMVNGPHNFGAQDFFNALIPYGLLGIANENATVSNWVQTHLNNFPEPGAPDQRTYRDRFNFAQSDMCNVKTGPDYVNSNFNNWFSGIPFGGSLFDVPIVSDALNVYGIMGQTGSAGRTTPKPPLYFYKGTSDEVSAVQDTTNLFNKYCAAGARITYVMYTGQTHVGAGQQGLIPAWDYLRDRFAGIAAPTTCTSTSVPSTTS